MYGAGHSVVTWLFFIHQVPPGGTYTVKTHIKSHRGDLYCKNTHHSGHSVVTWLFFIHQVPPGGTYTEKHTHQVLPGGRDVELFFSKMQSWNGENEWMERGEPIVRGAADGGRFLSCSGENFTAPQKKKKRKKVPSTNRPIAQQKQFNRKKWMPQTSFVLQICWNNGNDVTFGGLFKFGDWRSRCHVTTRLPV